MNDGFPTGHYDARGRWWPPAGTEREEQAFLDYLEAVARGNAAYATGGGCVPPADEPLPGSRVTG
jgi:hypothetical protein